MRGMLSPCSWHLLESDGHSFFERVEGGVSTRETLPTSSLAEEVSFSGRNDARRVGLTIGSCGESCDVTLFCTSRFVLTS